MIKYKLNIYCDYKEEILQDTFSRDTWDGYNESQYINHKIYGKLEGEAGSYPYPECSFQVEKGRVYYLVYILYTSGGTFGCTHGYFKVAQLCETIKDARKLQSLILESSKKSIYSNDIFEPKNNEVLSQIKNMTCEGFSFYDYLGYFEHLDDCEIKEIYT